MLCLFDYVNNMNIIKFISETENPAPNYIYSPGLLDWYISLQNTENNPFTDRIRSALLHFLICS